MASISLWGTLSWQGGIWLANAPTNPCYHNTDAAFDCSRYYQLSDPFCLCPGQQATTCSASSTKIYKTTPDHGKHHSPLDGHCYKDSEAQITKRGRPNAPHHPSSARSSQRNLDAPIPKELGLPSLEGGMLGS